MTRTNRELKLIFWGIVLLFVAFLAGPIVLLLGKSLWQGGLTGEFYTAVLSQDGFFTALGNSFAVAGASAAVAVLLAFSKALDELAEEGGIPARNRRYTENNRLLIQKMREMGFATYIDGRYQGPIITTFLYPAGVAFQFASFYNYIKERGYVIYPGKLTEMDTFRIGNIGEIYPEDIDKLTSIIAAFLEERKEQIA